MIVEGTGAGDPALSLLDYAAHVADVLTQYQERIADEGYLETDWDEEGGVLRVSVRGGLRPALCLIADRGSAYVLVIGPETGEASVRFGEGLPGEQPPTGSGNVTATYRQGSGEPGNLEIGGLRLEKPFDVVVVGDPRTATPGIFCRRTD